MRKTVATTNAPAAIGPYAQANVIGNLVFTSGQLGMIPETGELAEGLEAQTRQVFANLKAVLEEAGLDKIVKTTCFMADMKDFAAMNAIYAEYFDGEFPSRSAVQVAALPKGGLLEIEAVAYIGE